MNRVYPNRIDWENEPSTNTPINETNLNKIDYAVYEIDGRVVNYDLTKANQSDLLQTIKTLTYNTTTGVFVFEFWNGGTYTVDLNIEKIPVSFSMSESGVITMITADGTTYTCDISTLIKLYTFVDSSEIDFTTTTDASGNKNITASIKTGSIAAEKLQPNFLADCIAAKNAAQLAASNAQQSEDDASASALVSEGWANGKQNGVPVTEGSPYYHNNAEYWKDQANPTRLASLTDVDFSTLKDDEIIVYDATSQKWKNEVGVSADLKSNTTGQFNTRTGGKLESCVIAFEPKQSGSGTPSPSNVRPITGHSSVEVWEHGKNLFNYKASLNKNYYTSGDSLVVGDSSIRLINSVRVQQGKSYVLKWDNSKFKIASYVYTSTPLTQTTSDFSLISVESTSGTLTINALYDKYITFYFVPIQGSTNVYPIDLEFTQFELGSRATTYEPYQGQDITINLGGTYYGGKLDAVSGVLTVTDAIVDMETLNWYKDASGAFYAVIINKKYGSLKLLDSIYKTLETSFAFSAYSSYPDDIIGGNSGATNNFVYVKDTRYTDAPTYKTAMSGVQLVYELATPLAIQLTPQQINTLIGENHLDVPLEGQSLDSAVYRELFAWDDVNNVVKAVDDKNADVSAIGTDESGRTTASKAYAVGEHFYKDGKFCTAKTAIASGATFTLNTNYVEGNIADEFKSYLPKTVMSVEIAANSSQTINLAEHSFYMMYSYQPYVGGKGMFGISTWGSSVTNVQTISADSALTITTGNGQITVASTAARFITLVMIATNL